MSKTKPYRMQHNPPSVRVVALLIKAGLYIAGFVAFAGWAADADGWLESAVCIAAAIFIAWSLLGLLDRALPDHAKVRE